MIRMLVALTAGLGVLLAHAAPSEACGIKLTVQAPNVQNQSARSPNPSRILLVGSPPRRLARNLSNAGHRVDVAEDAESARRRDYPVVMADQEHVTSAREEFPNSTVVPRTGSTNQNMARIEQSLQRAPRDASGRRVARRVGGREREPIAVGRERQGSPDREPTAAGAEPGETDDAEAAEREAAERAERQRAERERAERERAERERAERERAERERAERERQPESSDSEPTEDPGDQERERVAMRDDEREREREDAVQRDHRTDDEPKPDGPAGEFHDEVFFGTNSTRLGSDARRSMRATAKWLKQNPNVSIVLEGHTDTPGNPKYNMRLSQRRAETTRDFLVSMGVEASRIEVEWFGEERPAYGDGVDGRNRRVELKR